MVLNLGLHRTLTIAESNLCGFIRTVGLGQRLNCGGVPFFAGLGHEVSLHARAREMAEIRL